MKFDKLNLKQFNIKLMIFGCILLFLLSIVLFFRSFAFYEEDQKFNIIQGEVPDQNYDTLFAFTLEDQGVQSFQEKIPEGRDYVVSVVCNYERLENGIMKNGRH